MADLPRWNFTWRTGDNEPTSVNVLYVGEELPTRVTALTAVLPGDVIRVSVSSDSYSEAVATATTHYMAALLCLRLHLSIVSCRRL